MPNFVNTLNDLIIEKGLNQTLLAEALNIDSSTVSKYLSENITRPEYCH